MDEIIDGNSNGDTVDWYYVVATSKVQINNNFIQEGSSNSDVIHEEDYEKPELI